MKHRPTDLELRLACAEVLGHKVFYQDYDDGKKFPYYIPSGKPKRTHMIDAMPLPDYPNDRNALPELYEIVDKVGAAGDFALFLVSGMRETSIFLCIRTTPRQQVVACLKALLAYKPEWDEDTGEETQT